MARAIRARRPLSPRRACGRRASTGRRTRPATQRTNTQVFRPVRETTADRPSLQGPSLRRFPFRLTGNLLVLLHDRLNCVLLFIYGNIFSTKNLLL